MKPTRICAVLSALCFAEAAFAAAANTYTLAPEDAAAGVAPTNA